MKRLILILLLLPLLMACKKQEFEGERPDERLSAKLEEYNTLLSSAAHGWKGHLFPSGGRGFGFYFKFNGKNRVTMMGDLLPESGTTGKESSYRLKATLLPSLYFDTYSYIHEIADPDTSISHGTPGWGLYSDFEFSFHRVTVDTIYLKGNLSGSDLILVRATQAEESAYESGQFNKLRKQVSDYFKDKRFNYLESPDGTAISTTLNLNRKTLSLTYDSAGSITTKQFGFAFSGLNELILSAPVRLRGLHFSKLLMNTSKNVLEVPGQTNPTVFLESEQPIFSLGAMMGIDFQVIAVPLEEVLAGSGADFNTRRQAFLTAGKAALAPGTTFPIMGLIFNPTDKSMIVQVIITQSNNNYVANYFFSYKKQENDYQFKYEGPMNQNAELLEQAFLPIIEGLVSGHIILDYDLKASEMRASGMSSSVPAFKFIGDLQ